jgi:Plastocyanin
MNRILLAVGGTVAAAALTLSACSSSSGGGSPASMSMPAPASTQPAGNAAPVANPKITIKNFGYSGDLTVKPGAKVTVVNDDSVAHTLTDKKTHKFDTGSINGGGGKGTFTAPTTPGSYPFGCTFHPEMAGMLVVKA